MLEKGKAVREVSVGKPATFYAVLPRYIEATGHGLLWLLCVRLSLLKMGMYNTRNLNSWQWCCELRFFYFRKGEK